MATISRYFRKKGILLCALILVGFTLATIFAPTSLAENSRSATQSVVMVTEEYKVPNANGQPVSTGGYGTGFAIGQVGKPVQYIATNYHVIQGAYENSGTVEVVFSAAANQYVQAEVYWKNPDKDLAILKLPEPTTQRKALVLCPEKKINLDDTFSALGYPVAAVVGNDFPKFDESDIVLTKGGISKQTRVNETDCYLLDLGISEGNSGGPLVNSNGEVVGINSFYIKTKAGATAADVKANYAISIDELINNINRDVIPITVAGEITTVTIIYIVCGVIGLAVLVLIAILLILRNKKKKSQSAQAEVPAPAVQSVVSGYQPTAPTQAVSVSVMGLSGYFQNRSFQVNLHLKFGRDNNRCNVVFPVDYPGISGTHCTLTADGSGNVSLTDEGSSYGTFLSNGTKLLSGQNVPLRNGDTFYLGDETNTFQIKIG